MQHRRWYQLHLLTLVILSVTAGLILWLNIPNSGFRYSGFAENTEPADTIINLKKAAGWPLTFVYERTAISLLKGSEVSRTDPGYVIEWPNLVVNLGAWLAILALVAVLCEIIQWKIRVLLQSPFPAGHLPNGMIPTVAITQVDYERLLPFNDTNVVLDGGASYRISFSAIANEPTRGEILYTMEVSFDANAIKVKRMPPDEAQLVLNLMRKGGLSRG